MHRLFFVLGLLAVVSSIFADEPSPAALRLMERIAYRCADLRPPTFPRPEMPGNVDREVEEFTRQARMLEDDLAALRQIFPGAMNSPVVVNGATFSELVGGTLATIERTDAMLRDDPLRRLKPEAFRLMEQIVYTCTNLPELAFPRPEERSDQEANDFRRMASYLERDIALLREIDPAAVSSPAPIRGLPFNERVTNALAAIARTRQALRADADAAPNADALAEVDWAIGVARGALRDTHDYGGLSTAHELYQKWLAQAAQVDPRAIEKRKSELEAVGSPFMAKYLAAKSAHEAELAKRKEAATANATAARRIAHLNLERRKAEAKKHGLTEFEEGIVNVIEQLQDGSLSVKEAKSMLIYHDPADDFRVQSVVGKYVVYGFSRRRAEFIQIAVVREKGEFYGKDAELAGSMFNVVGIEEFKTVLGAGQQLVVLKRIQ